MIKDLGGKYSNPFYLYVNIILFNKRLNRFHMNRWRLNYVVLIAIRILRYSSATFTIFKFEFDINLNSV